MKQPALLVIRLSAMGDVALTVPSVSEAARHARVVVLTRPLFSAFFGNIPNVEVVKVNTGSEYRGLAGIIKLYRVMRKSYDISAVIDLHSVIRSRILSMIFTLDGTKVFRIDKGRKARRAFIKHRKDKGLIHTSERYRKVFRDAGINLEKEDKPVFSFTDIELKHASSYLGNKAASGNKLIGFAPYAKHVTKQWPLIRISRFLELLSERKELSVFLFGGYEEKESLLRMAGDYKNVFVAAGEFSLREELALVSKMDVMISMDSSNLHMASLSGVKTISIWGGTHTAIGFAPSGKQEHEILEISLDELACRPCTVYGKGECRLKDDKYRCLYDIDPDKAVEALRRLKVLT